MVSWPFCLVGKHPAVPKIRFYCCRTVVGLLMWNTPPDEKTGLSLQLLLSLARAVILSYMSYGTYNHILLSPTQDSPNLEDQVPIFIYPWNNVAQSTSWHWIPFLSPPKTHRATVEVFKLTSTQEPDNC
jgi:hypothetical protein